MSSGGVEAMAGKPSGPGKEYGGGEASFSVPPVGQSVVSSAANALSGRIDILRDGVRIATAKAAFHASEISGHAALAWPNPNPFTRSNIVTTFEAPSGA